MKQGIYQHYKGPSYLVLGSALDSTNSNPRPMDYVIYYSFDADKLRLRQEFEFNQTVDPQIGMPVLITHPGAVQRFKFVRETTIEDLLKAIGASFDQVLDVLALTTGDPKPDGTDSSKMHRSEGIDPSHLAPYGETICNLMLESANVRDVNAYGGKIVSRCVVANALAHALAKEGLLKSPSDASKPIDMILFCPSCHERHFDEGEYGIMPHRTHECQKCGFLWAPAKVATRGVQKIVVDPAF